MMFEFIRKNAVILCIFYATYISIVYSHEECLARVSTCTKDGTCPIEDSYFSMPLVGPLKFAQYAPGEYGVLYPCSFARYGLSVQAPGCTSVSKSVEPHRNVFLNCTRSCGDRTKKVKIVNIKSSCQKDLAGLGLSIGPQTQNSAFLSNGSVYIETRKLPVNVAVYHPDHATLNLALTTSKSMVELQCKVNGGWSTWIDGPCSQTCGNGITTRSRRCDEPATANDGLPCDGNSEVTVPCNTTPCPVNGGWGTWVDGTCSQTCGNGIITRTRRCDYPEPANDGLLCDGNSEDTVTCNTTPCPGDWLEWSECSCNAPPGTASARRRTRPCTDTVPPSSATPCSASELVEYEPCTLTTNCVTCQSGCCIGSTYQLLPQPGGLLPQQAKCNSLGGKLVEINCAEELTLIVQMIIAEGNPNDNLHLGMTRVSDTIIYLSNQQQVSFVGDWSLGEPNNILDCFEILSQGVNFQWRDNFCDDNEQGICEFT